MHAYKPKVNDFVLAPTAREDFWSASTGRTILPHGTFGQHILPGRAGGENTGSEKSMVSHGAAAKVWFQSRQNYDSRHISGNLAPSCCRGTWQSAFVEV